MITHTVDYSMVWNYTVDYGMVWNGLLHWGWAERAYQDVRTALPMGTDFQGSMLGNHSQTRDVNASSSFKNTQGNVKQTKQAQTTLFTLPPPFSLLFHHLSEGISYHNSKHLFQSCVV